MYDGTKDMKFSMICVYGGQESEFDWYWFRQLIQIDIREVVNKTEIIGDCKFCSQF